MIFKATNNDFSIIQHIAKTTWPVTFGEILSNQQIDYMLDLIYSDKSLSKQLSEGHDFYILNDENKNVGYIDIQKVDDHKSKLHKIYLLPDAQGKGYGKILMNFAIEKTKENGTPALQLNVNRYNPALDFYQKLGFRIIREEDIPIGNNYFMNDFVLEKIIE